MERLRLGLFSTLVACIAFLAAASPALAQTAGGFRYAIPRFTSKLGSELIVANLSSRLATPEITLVDSATGQFADIFVNLQAGTQTRFTAQSFGLSSFEGSILVTQPGVIPVTVTNRGPSGGSNRVLFTVN